MKSILTSCHYASLSHQRVNCKTGPLFLFSKSMSQDEPGFRYMKLFNISFFSNYNKHLELTATVSNVLIMIVAETGRHF